MVRGRPGLRGTPDFGGNEPRSGIVSERVLRGHLTQTPPCSVVETEAQRVTLQSQITTPALGPSPSLSSPFFPVAPTPCMPCGMETLHMQTLCKCLLPTPHHPCLSPRLQTPQLQWPLAFPPSTPHAATDPPLPSWALLPPRSQPPGCEFLIYESDPAAPGPQAY